ncbi:unnamed protein product [Owenia fusiformis]|uniref:Uncharacterized protein n=1 Tax=Owenia fusiformis TaxID=6347 RepID=A0A8S4PEQ3_OWEFU|nr:unnamed protein product [Owenia fusiformis]
MAVSNKLKQRQGKNVKMKLEQPTIIEVPGHTHNQADPDVEKDLTAIKNALLTGMRQSAKFTKNKQQQQSAPSSSNELRVKCDFQGEKRAMQIRKPVKYADLCEKVKQYYGRSLQIFYTPSNNEVVIPISSQQDLDSAVELVERSEHMKSLRLRLQADSNSNSLSPASQPPGKLGEIFQNKTQSSSKTGNNNTLIRVPEGRYSPPPGTVQPHEKHFQSQISRHSGEGEFIPEAHNDEYESPDSSVSGSRTSLDSSFYSTPGDTFNHGDTFPLRGKPTSSRRSVYSDTTFDEPSSGDGRVKGGTYPRRFNNPTEQMEPEGRKTFPRVRGTNHELYQNELQHRYGSSRGSAGSLSTSSSSSGQVPDFDSPEGRRRRETPRAPTNWKRGKILGSGAFGQVFVCYDGDTGRELAVKQVPLGTPTSETSKEIKALECEIQLLKNIHHDRIVQYYGCQEDEKHLCIFMDYMAGGSVKDELRTYGACKENVTRKYTRQVLEGLAYLHDRLIVHRDIKGANILRDAAGNVKIGDFGASKRLQTIATSTGMKSVIGTPYWMSPEVINGDGYGRKADIWSVGCTVVEMLTKNPPWIEFEAMAAIFKIATTDTPKYELPKETSDVARDFLRIIFRKKQQERPTAEELLRHKFCNDFS